MDRQHFLLLAQHHRLVPLISQNLHASVAEPRSPALDALLHQLHQLSRDNAHQALLSLAELRRVVKEFQAHDIPVGVLKGLPLAQSVFGDFGLRAVGDIDLLIDQSAILQADRVLRGFGYRGLFQMERLTPRQFAFYRAHWRDNAYRNPATGFEIDLHWRLFRNSRMPGAGLCDTPAGQSISFADFRVETLLPPENLLYLCVHGAFDGWLFLKSLADVAAQVRTMSEAELDSLATLADDYGVLPELSAALTLVPVIWRWTTGARNCSPSATPPSATSFAMPTALLSRAASSRSARIFRTPRRWLSSLAYAPTCATAANCCCADLSRPHVADLPPAGLLFSSIRCSARSSGCSSGCASKKPHPIRPLGRSLRHGRMGLSELCRRSPNLPHTYACSTIGPTRLNFRVRDGNGWDPRSKLTGKLSKSSPHAIVHN